MFLDGLERHAPPGTHTASKGARRGRLKRRGKGGEQARHRDAQLLGGGAAVRHEVAGARGQPAMEQLRASLASIDAMRQEGLLSDAEAAELKARELAAMRQNSELELRARQETAELELRARQETVDLGLDLQRVGLDLQRKSLGMMDALTPALAEAVRTGRCLPAGWRALQGPPARPPTDDTAGSGTPVALGVQADPRVQVQAHPRVQAARQLRDATHQLAAPLATAPAPAAAAAAATAAATAAVAASAATAAVATSAVELARPSGRTGAAWAGSASGDAALDAGNHVGSSPSKSLEGSSLVRRRPHARDSP